MDKTYSIIRFYQDSRPREVIETGLTLEEAQEHCQRDDTKGGDSGAGTGWFDGYEAE
jgi:hypothetical protein